MKRVQTGQKPEGKSTSGTSGKNRESTEPAPGNIVVQLIGLILAAINSLNLTKGEVKRWTNNGARLRQWVALLKTDWMPPKTTPVFQIEKKPLITLTEVALSWVPYDESEVTSALGRIQIFHSDQSPITDISESVQLRAVSGRNAIAPVVCTVIDTPQGWCIEFFRDVFGFKGQDSVLIEAFVAKNVVWPLHEVIQLMASMIHNPQNDPFDLQGHGEGVWFPVYIGPVKNNGDIDVKLVPQHVAFMFVSRSEKKHLGNDVWTYRVADRLDELLMSSTSESGITRPGSVIIFSNNPLQ